MHRCCFCCYFTDKRFFHTCLCYIILTRLYFLADGTLTKSCVLCMDLCFHSVLRRMFNLFVNPCVPETRLNPVFQTRSTIPIKLEPDNYTIPIKLEPDNDTIPIKLEPDNDTITILIKLELNNDNITDVNSNNSFQ